MRTLLIIIACAFGFQGLAFQKTQPEVLIIGTMHEVPKVVKHSYKPLLKMAKRYGPDAIYVERQRPEDSLSLANYESRWFLPKGDTLRQSFQEDCLRTERLQTTSVREMNQEDFAYLRDYYIVNRDKANWHYYAYLAKHGLSGSRKPLRNENTDLTAKLAIHMDMNFIYAMDHQHETQSYSKYWRDCIRQSKKDGEIKYHKKAYRKDSFKDIWAGLLGRLGKRNQKPEAVKSYDLFNRFDFRKTACEPCDKAAAVWDRRNAGMAANIGNQMLEHGHQRAVVIVGAGHLLGIRDELKKQFPGLKVMIRKDL